MNPRRLHSATMASIDLPALAGAVSLFVWPMAGFRYPLLSDVCRVRSAAAVDLGPVD